MWEKLRKILRQAFRVLTACFMAVVVAGALSWTWITIKNHRLERKVSQTHEWAAKTLPLTVPITATLKTRCKDFRMSYQLSLKPKNPDEKFKFRDVVMDIEGLGFVLSDGGGFEVIDVKGVLGRLHFVSDENGNLIGAEINDSTSCDREAYADTENWHPYWTPVALRKPEDDLPMIDLSGAKPVRSNKR